MTEGSRGGLVYEVEATSPFVLMSHGEGLRQVKLPEGSRVIYPPEPTPGLEDPDAAIRYALDNPLSMDPLRALLEPGMRLTIAFDDISTPVPSMAQPDNRQRVIEAVLDMANEAGVDDVVLMVARGFRRKMTEGELRHVLGDRVYNALAPYGLIQQHDAEDADNLVEIGATSSNTPVAINKRVADSDLTIYVGSGTVGRRGGYNSVFNGLTSYETFNSNFIQSSLHPESIGDDMGRILADTGINFFMIQTTNNTWVYPKNLAFLQGREGEWTARQRVMMTAVKKGLDLIPHELRGSIISPAQMTSVFAGEAGAVEARIQEQLRRQHLVEVQGQADILSMGIPGLGPYNVGARMNPIMMQALGLGYLMGLHTGLPLVRKGGVVIMSHPTEPVFDDVRHASYHDFYEGVLPMTTDMFTMLGSYHGEYAQDLHYRHRYQEGSSHHGTHPFYLWYSGAAQASLHLGGIIVVGGDANAVKRMGMRPASDFESAYAMARGILGTRYPLLTHIHTPPAPLADVR